MCPRRGEAEISPAARAGIGAGASVGAVLVLMGLAFLVRRRLAASKANKSGDSPAGADPAEGPLYRRHGVPAGRTTLRRGRSAGYQPRPLLLPRSQSPWTNTSLRAKRQQPGGGGGGWV